ncbi:hypothetical protein BASA81_008093 [Batrachochytrium salamandrivorans]|nr:hypothetical protein BASA81_008093 [Batrachochytrium salamandrivorans]
MTIEEEQWQASFMATVFTPQQRSAILTASVDYSTPQTTTWTIECGSKEGASMLMRDFNGVLLRGNTIYLVFHHDAPQQEPPTISYTLLKKPTTFPLHITGLPEHFTTAQLLHLFQQRYSTCVSAFTVSNRGYGFVRFSDERERTRALEEMDRFVMSGSVLRMNLFGGNNSFVPEVKQERTILNDQATLFPSEPPTVLKSSKQGRKAATEEEEEEEEAVAPKTKSKRKQTAAAAAVVEEEVVVAAKKIKSKRKDAPLDEEEEEEPVKPKKKRKQEEDELPSKPRKRSKEEEPVKPTATPNFENMLLHAEKEVAILQGEKRILELEYRLVGLEGEKNAAIRLLGLTEQHLVAEQKKVRVLEFQLSLEQSKHSVVFYLWPLLDHCCRALFGEGGGIKCWEELVDLILKRQKRRLSAWGRETCRELEREITAEEESQVTELLLMFPTALSQQQQPSLLPPSDLMSSVTKGFVCSGTSLVQRVAVGLCVLQVQLALMERNRPTDAMLLQFPVYYLGGGNKFKLYKSRLRSLD